MNVYFLRHGQSLFNFNNEDDQIDCSLTLLGIEQSKNIESKFFSLVICSPLSRCIQTLKHSKITFDSLQINHLVREIQSGCKSDLLNESEPIRFENEQEIQQRINDIHQYLVEIKDEFRGKDILIVSHADLIWNLTGREINGERFGSWLNNAELFHWKIFE